MPKKFAVVGVGLRTVALAPQVLLVQDATGLWSLPAGVPGDTESAAEAAVRLVLAATGWQGTALAGLLELFPFGAGPIAVGVGVVNAASAQPPPAGMTPAWLSIAAASVDLEVGRPARDAESLNAALGRLVDRWTGARPGP